MPPQPPAQLHSIPTRHHHIQQEQRWPRALRIFDDGSNCKVWPCGVSRTLQLVTDEAIDIRIVLQNKNCLGLTHAVLHRAELSSAQPKSSFTLLFHCECSVNSRVPATQAG